VSTPEDGALDAVFDLLEPAEVKALEAFIESRARTLAAAAKTEAIREIALRWQTGSWAEVLARPPVGLPALDYGQRVTDWLRAQAESESS
jgi:hypothetical protein